MRTARACEHPIVVFSILFLAVAFAFLVSPPSQVYAQEERQELVTVLQNYGKRTPGQTDDIDSNGVVNFSDFFIKTRI